MGSIGDTSPWEWRPGPFTKVPFSTPYAKGYFKFDDHIRPQEQVTRQVMEFLSADHESKVRAALIELGWTPPPE